MAFGILNVYRSLLSSDGGGIFLFGFQAHTLQSFIISSTPKPMRITRVTLHGSNGDQSPFPLEVQFSGTEPQIIRGPNGSGKTLLTEALRAVFAEETEFPDRCRRIEELGIQSVVAEVETDHVQYSVTVRPAETKRYTSSSAQSEDADGNGRVPNTSDEPHSDTWIRKAVEPLHIIVSGNLSLPLEAEWLDGLSSLVCEPMERELAGWSARQEALIGADGEGGRLGAIRRDLSDAESARQKVETLAARVWSSRELKETIRGKIREAHDETQVLKAEIKEAEKLESMSQRTVRLKEWLDEMRTELQTVTELRRHHEESQQKLDENSERFQNVPENFGELLTEYLNLKDREREIVERLDAAERRHALDAEELEDVEGRLARLTPPSVTEFETKKNELLLSIKETEEALSASLRDRAALSEERDRIRRKLDESFSEFSNLKHGDKEALERIGDLLKLVRDDASEADAVDRAITDRIRDIRQEIGHSYRGFDLLPENTPALLEDLYSKRSLLYAQNVKLEELHDRRIACEGKSTNRWKVLIGGLAALLGFTVGTYLYSWDIGLFAALVISGFCVLVLKIFGRGKEKRLAAVLDAEEMCRAQWKRAFEDKEKLERSLRVLADCDSKEKALDQYSDYLKLSRELAELEQKRRAVESSPASTSKKEMESLLRGLPSSLSAVSPERLVARWNEYAGLERDLKAVNNRWTEFGETGARTEAMGKLERHVSHLKRELDELKNRHNRIVEDYEAIRRNHEARLKELKQDEQYAASLRNLRGEQEAVRERINDLIEASNGVLSSEDPEPLRDSWQETVDLRAKLRQIRDQLSPLRPLDEIHARVNILAEEYETIKQQLSELDPLFLIQGSLVQCLQKYRSMVESLQKKAADREARIAELEQQLEDIDIDELLRQLEDEPTIEELEQQVHELTEQREAVEREAATTGELVASVREELQEHKRTFGPNLLERVAERIRNYTDGRLQGLGITDGEFGIVYADGSLRRITVLSGGLLDLIWLAVRVEILESLASCESLPVIWDEPFPNLDDVHLHQICKDVTKLSSQRQVVLLTRDGRLESEGKIIRLQAAPPLPIQH